MRLWMIRAGLALVGNALGLWLAAVLLDGMTVSGFAFLVAVALFTVLLVVLSPVASRTATKYADSVRGLSALVATAVALLLTALITDGLAIDGIGTWIVAAVIVWLSTLIIGVVLTRLVADRYQVRDTS